MIAIKVICSNGNSWITSFNLTLKDARNYFIGQLFVREDNQGNETRDIPVTVEEV